MLIPGTFLVEQCQSISIDDYVREAKLKLKKGLIEHALEADEYNLGLAVKEMHHGGLRYYFTCPDCFRSVIKLYKHPVTQITSCRSCNGLEYRCRKKKGMLEEGIRQ